MSHLTFTDHKSTQDLDRDFDDHETGRDDAIAWCEAEVKANLHAIYAVTWESRGNFVHSIARNP